MLPIEKYWFIPPRLPPEADQALQNYHPVLRQILYNRGHATPEAARLFLEAAPPPGTSAFNLGGISQAIERIKFAIQRQEAIAVYGDYDADGVTATALLTLVLKSLGADVRSYIPNRFDEGYGLNIEAIDNLHVQGVRLIITVDCGIRSIAEADHARRLGLDLIISDHHHPAPEIPMAVALINPKLPGDPYPDKDLAGVGLAYKLASALLVESSSINTEEYLDLVALGTVADLAPLVKENRHLVRQGLRLLRSPRRQGIHALIAASGLNPASIDAGHIGFILAPRLNAAGRLETALASLELLLTQEVNRAAVLAQKLDNLNRERQQITRQIQEHAERVALAQDPETPLLFAAHPDYNPGVVGLAASRLVEQYYRPAIIAHIGPEYTRGSCRSIPEFHITQALDQCSDLLEHHGGHAAAAGFTIRNEYLPVLIERLKTIASQHLSPLQLRPIYHADIEIPLSDLKPELLPLLESLEPTGYGNPQVQFVSRNLKVTRYQVVGKDSSHLRLSVTDGRITYDAIAFRQGHWFERMPCYVDLLYTFEKNEFNGKASLQLNVRDIKEARGW